MLNCRLAVISWPISQSNQKPTSYKDIFINLGEIYDENVRNDTKLLYELHVNLKYLYPFKIKNGIPYNIEDFKPYQEKYKLSCININMKLKNEVYHTPCLYDLSCMKPLFFYDYRFLPTIPSFGTPKIFIILPYSCPIIRGNILDTCIRLSNQNSLYVLSGDKYENNKNTTSTLSSRYLRKRGISMKSIIKNLYNNFPTALLDIFEILNLLVPDYKDYQLFISCYSKDIYRLMMFIKIRNIKKLLNLTSNIQYICE